MSVAKIKMKRDTSPTTKDVRHMILHEATIFLNISELLQSIVEWAVELLQADAGEIYLWDPARQELRQWISCGFAAQYIGATLKPGEGMAGKVFQSGKPIIVDDYLAWEGRSAVYETVPPFTAVIEVPMKVHERTIGVLGMDVDARRRTFNQNDIRPATLFANVAAVAIENARMYEILQVRAEGMKRILEQEVAERTTELIYRARQLELSARVSREITSILNIDKLLARVVELITEAFGYYHVQIFLVDQETDRLILVASSSAVRPQFQCLNIGPGSLNGTVAQTGEALMVNDVAKDPRYQLDEVLPHTRSELVVPLRLGGRVVGTLDVQSDKVNTFSQEDVLVMQSLGDQVAIAIENARLYDRSRDLAVLEERNRLARELHDSVTQSLFSIDLHARAISAYLERDLQQAEVQVQQLRQITRDALQEMRSLIYDLRPCSLEDLGLVPALRQHIRRLCRPDGPEVVLQVVGERRLPSDVEQGLFRIAQEALRNAIKHAGAGRVAVTLTMLPEQVTLRVTDDGRGFDPTSLPTGRRAFGLVGMRERAELLNGTFDIVSQPGAGTEVKVQVPA